ncbi:squalene monooxygenase-like [Senna tora]|uniref:Squalene monooxygenase n=1 Tax=Senna tora TaxID=362788 RepID=A0A834T5B9_9FABA|nr:squalene monooxygenase-like [Senna tora]
MVYSDQITALTASKKPGPPKIFIVLRTSKREIRFNCISFEAERGNKISIFSSPRRKFAYAHTTLICKDYSLKCTRSLRHTKLTSASPTDSDVIIVGAGVAGSALAYTLGKDGRCVHVIERDLTEPDRIVGELLQPGGYLKLIELGLEDCVEQIDAQRVLGYALFKDGKHTKLSYPLENFHADVAGRSFHNGRFIQRMRGKAADLLKYVRMEQGNVTSLLEENGTIKGVQYKTKDGRELKAFAPLTIVCDGCFSNLRRSLCHPKIEVSSCFVGLILENCQLPFAYYGHVILADPSPILFYQISSTEVRCLVDVPGQKLPSIGNGEMANYLKNVVAPQIPPELHDAFVSAVNRGNIRTMPNKSMPSYPRPTPGALLMGDAFNMRHPLTGGGVTVAMSDIVVLRDLLRPLHDLNDVAFLCKYLESFYTLRKPVASTINTLAGALYKVFSASPDQARNELRQACFDYLSIGSIFSNGPMALLSALNPRPLSLVLHFFAVAIYGAGRLLLPFPSFKRIWIGARLISARPQVPKHKRLTAPHRRLTFTVGFSCSPSSSPRHRLGSLPLIFTVGFSSAASPSLACSHRGKLHMKKNIRT